MGKFSTSSIPHTKAARTTNNCSMTGLEKEKWMLEGKAESMVGSKKEEEESVESVGLEKLILQWPCPVPAWCCSAAADHQGPDWANYA